jgi:MFS family permease
VIYASCVIGAAGALIVAGAPSVIVAEVGVLLLAVASGAFLSVDWALMTDIIPKASSGRYMGISNVATACAGPLALLTGGTLMDIVGGREEAGSGPRAAFVVGVALFAIGALLLTRVEERRREDEVPGEAAIEAMVETEQALL